jgi:hypothetical protein
MTQVDALDELLREGKFARGLVVAIRGLAAEAEGDDANDYAGVVELAEVHAERLRKIAGALVQIARKQAEAAAKRTDGPTWPPPGW